jgi:hypothetical protein
LPELPSRELAEAIDLLPAAGAGLLLFVLGAWLSRRGSFYWAVLGSVLGLSVACGWTFVRVRGAPAFPPRMSTERAFWGVTLAAVLALAAALPGVPPRLRLLPAAVAGPVLVFWIGKGVQIQGLAFAPVVALGAIAFLLLLERASGCPGPLFGLLAAVALGATAQVLGMFRSALLAQLAGAAAVTTGLIALASAFVRSPAGAGRSGAAPTHQPTSTAWAPRPLPRALATTLGAVALAVSVDSVVFSYETPPRLALVLMAAAPLAPLAFFGGSAERPRALRRALGAAVLGLAFAVAGFVVAARAAPPSFF